MLSLATILGIRMALIGPRDVSSGCGNIAEPSLLSSQNEHAACLDACEKLAAPLKGQE